MNTILSCRCVRQGSALFVGLLLSIGSAYGQRVALTMHPASLPAAAADQGPLPQSSPAAVTVYLQPSADRIAALGQYLVAVQAPGNPAYHAWLSPAQFGQQFGATPDQVEAVSSWAQGNGLAVGNISASRLSIALTGNVAQVEGALAPGLHSILVGGSVYVANTNAPSIAQSVASDVVGLSGLSNLPGMHPMTVTSAAGAVTRSDFLASVAADVDVNTSRILSLSGTTCIEDVDTGSQTAMHLLLQQASAQGMTVLATSGCGARGSAGFPAALSEVTAAAPSLGITPPAHATLSELRPAWQNAPGLPSDAFRHEPDMAVSSLPDLQATVAKILSTFPASADGSPARLGNINGVLYELAPMKGLYTQPDGAAAGTWEPATGLGLIDLAALAKFFPHGTLATDVSLTVSNYSPTHGTSITFTSRVKDVSGQGNGVVPTGTVTFTLVGPTTITLGPVTLNSGTATLMTSQLPGGTYSVTSQYSGDGTYSAAPSDATDNLQILAEAANITGSEIATVPLGGTVTLQISVASNSGVGTPTGKVVVTPTGTPDTNTYSGQLSGSGGTATAIVTAPAVQAGNDVFLVTCDNTDPSFTCNTQRITASVTKATPSVTLTSAPNPPVSGQNVTLNATLTPAGNGATAPTGNVNFSNNGVVIGSGTVQGGVATLTTSNFNYSASGNTFTANYGGDNNYNSSTSSSSASGTLIATTTTVAVSSTSVPVGGMATLYAVVVPTTTGAASIGGTVTFVEGTLTLCKVTVSAGSANCSVQFNTRGANGPIEANYSGDTNYMSSSSGSQYVTVSVIPGNTQTVVTASPATPVAGQPTTFTATVTNTNGSTSNVSITGNVSFYVNGTAVNALTLSNGQVSYTTTLANGPETVYAVYSGDGNWNGSTSPTLSYNVGSSTTGTGNGASNITLTSNTLFTVAGANIVLTATIAPPAGSTSTAALSGSVVFYDLYNGGQTTALATVGVTSTGPGLGVAQTSSTGLKSGRHVITAVYSGNGSYASETSAPLTIFLSDYSLTFAPPSLTLAAGSSASSTVTVTPLTSFGGTVSLACVPPTLVYITCSFSPATVSATGTSTLTVTTQVHTAENRIPLLREMTGGVALAGLLFGFLAPRRRRLRPVLLALLLTAAALGSVGCTTLKNAGTNSPLGFGTPTGTYNLTITSAGTDQGATVTHSQQFQVTVQ